MYVHMYNAEYVQTAEMRHGKIRTWVGVFHRALPHLPESRAMCDVRVEGGERVIREREGFQLRETFEHAQVIDAGFLVVVDLVAARGGGVDKLSAGPSLCAPACMHEKPSSGVL